jgi:hypothetical protein
MKLERKKQLYNFWRPPTNSNHQLTVSEELKFKKSSTASSSLVKFLRN